MSVEEYEPKSTLVVPEHHPVRAKYPFIDVHNHQDTAAAASDVERIVREMDAMNMRVMVNLSVGSGEALASGVAGWKGRHPGRFVTFANLDFTGIDDPGWGARAAAQLEEDVRRGGAQGLKIFKNFGLTVKDRRGRRVEADDPRLDPVFEKCRELGIPVLIHTGEPRSFFEPQDRFNERWLELKQFPQRARPSDRFPTFEQVMGEQHRLFARHPRTQFIDAHLGWLGATLALSESSSIACRTCRRKSVRCSPSSAVSRDLRASGSSAIRTA